MPDKPTFYLTTAIDYPNALPHIGTAFEKIGADVQARYRRIEGYDVHFLMGNDEHTVKVARRAEELGRDPKDYCDDMAAQFGEVWASLEISHDDFIQTSEQRHRIGIQKFFQAVADNGDIYKSSYESLYCEGCEEFKTERALEGGKCPNHPQMELKSLQEENYFFALSKYRDRLLELYEKNPDFVQPEIRRNEVVNLVKGGLEDISVSRRGFKWGVPVPFDPEQTIYVWFDALLNYITAAGYGTDEERFNRLWPADVHFIGKDITRFHCALWPAMLMSAGVEVPRSVFAHGFVYIKDEDTDQRQKISKSLGNVVEPMDIVSRFNADAFRYYFMRECPFGGDGDFSFHRFSELYNSDLANNLGNLYSRTAAMLKRYFDGVLEETPADGGEVFGAADLPGRVQTIRGHYGACRYSHAVQAIWDLLDVANRYIEQTRPFELAKTDPEACRRVLANLVESLRVASILTAPIIPEASRTIWGAFNFVGPHDAATFDQVTAGPTTEGPVRLTAELDAKGKVVPLFPRIQK